VERFALWDTCLHLLRLLHPFMPMQVPIKELAAHGIRPEIPTYERLWYNTSKVCECLQLVP
jgi:hypothetical protein